MRAQSPSWRPKGARVLQMGAGFIGCIIMEALAARGVQLTRGRDGRPHGAAHDGPDGRRHDQGLVREEGRAVFTGTRVEAIEAGAPLRVRLSGGQQLEADLVISATGVKPNIGFLENCGVRACSAC